MGKYVFLDGDVHRILIPSENCVMAYKDSEVLPFADDQDDESVILVSCGCCRHGDSESPCNPIGKAAGACSMFEQMVK